MLQEEEMVLASRAKQRKRERERDKLIRLCISVHTWEHVCEIQLSRKERDINFAEPQWSLTCA